MPFFKSTYNIFLTPDEDEVFNPNWMDSDTLVLPPKIEWDYSRELQIEDVDIWEVVYEQGDGLGVYASWLPYAEFYMITNASFRQNTSCCNEIGVNRDKIETYYGQNAQRIVQKRMKELNIPFHLNTHWVEPEDMWLYQTKEIVDLIL